MQRLDKYLANLWLLSRREAPLKCKKGEVLLNWEITKKSDIKMAFISYGDFVYPDCQLEQVSRFMLK